MPLVSSVTLYGDRCEDLSGGFQFLTRNPTWNEAGTIPIRAGTSGLTKVKLHPSQENRIRWIVEDDHLWFDDTRDFPTQLFLVLVRLSGRNQDPSPGADPVSCIREIIELAIQLAGEIGVPITIHPDDHYIGWLHRLAAFAGPERPHDRREKNGSAQTRQHDQLSYRALARCFRLLRTRVLWTLL